MDFIDRLANAYFFAKHYVIDKGYSDEIDWQMRLCFNNVTEQVFLQEISWVILASGMSDKVISKIYPSIKEAFFEFSNCELIIKNRDKCLNKALMVFNNKKKIEAILFAVEYLYKSDFELIKSNIQNQGITYLQIFPFIGAATSYHLAKNLGIDVAKPDRHLVRVSTTLGLDNPHQLCSDLSERINEKASIIDLVIWRYATIDKNYIKNLSWFMNRYETYTSTC